MHIIGIIKFKTSFGYLQKSWFMPLMMNDQLAVSIENA